MRHWTPNSKHPADHLAMYIHVMCRCWSDAKRDGYFTNDGFQRGYLTGIVIHVKGLAQVLRTLRRLERI